MQTQCDSDSPFDAFRILGLPRRPFLEAELIKQRYLESIKEVHPDHTQTASPTEATEINQAQKTLENDADRIAHLLELETGEDIRQDRNVPESLIDIFMRLGPTLNEADRLLAEIKAETTTILRAQLFLKASPILSTLSAFQTEVNEAVMQARSSLKEADTAWPPSAPEEGDSTREQLREIYRHLSFLNRWQTKIMETSFELTPS